MEHSVPSFLYAPISGCSGCNVPRKVYVKVIRQRRAENVGRLYSLDHPELIKVFIQVGRYQLFII